MPIEADVLSADRQQIAGTCSRSLEKIARAATGEAHDAGSVVAREARELLECDVAFVLKPAPQRESVALAGVATGRKDEAEAGSLWRLGKNSPRIFERPSHTADGWRQPWSCLRQHLEGFGVRTWTGIPLRADNEGEALGLLAVGSEHGSRPCRRMDRIHDLARSSVAALSLAETQTHRASGVLPREMPHPQTIGSIAFGVSHTLANVFGAMLGNLHFLREELEGQDCEQLLDRLQSSTSEGIELMRSLQAFTSVPACSGMAPVNLGDLAAEALDFVRTLCSHWPSCRAISLEVEAQSSCKTWGHAGQLREVLIGLVFNAMHAVGSEGRIIVTARPAGDWSELAVRDDGPGMDNEVLRRATEPFFTTDPDSYQGLGLTVARGVAVGHRGGLHIVRGKPRGLEVVLRLPSTPPAAEQSELTVARALSATASSWKGATQ